MVISRQEGWPKPKPVLVVFHTRMFNLIWRNKMLVCLDISRMATMFNCQRGMKTQSWKKYMDFLYLMILWFKSSWQLRILVFEATNRVVKMWRRVNTHRCYRTGSSAQGIQPSLSCWTPYPSDKFHIEHLEWPLAGRVEEGYKFMPEELTGGSKGIITVLPYLYFWLTC